MRVALVDPSLFTLPYDVALAEGLMECGAQVTLHGRALRPADGEPGGLRITPSFYRLSERPAASRLPKPARLALKGFDHLSSMLRLQSRFRSDRPDIIHFQWLPLPLLDSRLLSIFRRIAPIVLTVHDTDPFNGAPTAGLQKLGFTRVLNGCDQLVVHTQQGLSRLAAMGVPLAKLSKLPHGRLAAASPGSAPDDMQGPMTFVLFGKIKPYKGADLLVEAFAVLPAALRRVARIRIVGQPYMDLRPLHAQAESLGVADLIDIEPRFVADGEMAGIFAPGSVAVFPYREIEASGVLSLATAHGRPVIASRIGNFGETIMDFVHGRLVPAGDAASLSAAMRHFIEDRTAAAGYAAEVRILDAAQPSWKDIAHGTLRVYAKAEARLPARNASLDAATEVAS